jgi:hypothetical protein
VKSVTGLPLWVLADRKAGRLAKLVYKGENKAQDLLDVIESLITNSSKVVVAREKTYVSSDLEYNLKRLPVTIKKYKSSLPINPYLLFETRNNKLLRALARAILKNHLPREVIEIDLHDSKIKKIKLNSKILYAFRKAEESASLLIERSPLTALVGDERILLEALYTAWELLQPLNEYVIKVINSTNLKPVTSKTQHKLNLITYQLYIKEAALAITLHARNIRPPAEGLDPYFSLELELKDSTSVLVTSIPPGHLDTTGYLNNILDLLKITAKTSTKIAIVTLYPITIRHILRIIEKSTLRPSLILKDLQFSSLYLY